MAASKELEVCIQQLLSPRNREFLLGLRGELDKDPMYLHYHKASTELKVDYLLRPLGIDCLSLFESHPVDSVLKEAFSRLTK